MLEVEESISRVVAVQLLRLGVYDDEMWIVLFIHMHAPQGSQLEK